MKKTFLPIFWAMMLTLAVASCGNSGSGATTATDSVAASVATDGATILRVDSISTLDWKGSKPGGEHFGKISIQEGSIAVKDGKLVAGSVSIDMASIKVEDLQGEMAQKLKEHLESEDFFDAEKYPLAKFELTDLPAEGISLSELKELSGNLTLKDVTKNITIPVTVTGDQESGYKVKSATFVIDRSQWNVKYGSKSFFGDLGDKFIENDIALSFDLTLK